MNAKQSLLRRFALPATLVLVLGGAVLWMLSGDHAASDNSGIITSGQDGRSNSLSGSGEAADYGLETAAELLEYRMQVGRSYSYNFQRSMDATVQGDSLVALNLGGELTPHVIAERDGRIDLIMRVRFDQSGGIPAEDLPAFRASGAATPEYLAYLQIDRSGRPLFLRFPAAIQSQAEQGLIRDVLATWLQPLPARGAAVRMRNPDATGNDNSSWWSYIGLGDEADERPAFVVAGTDTQGEFQGMLSLRDADELAELDASGKNDRLDGLYGFAYDLSKERYSQSLTPIAIESSEHLIEWQLEHGVFRDSSGTDRLRMGPADFLVDSQTRYSYKLGEVGDSLYGPADLAQFTIVSDIYDVESYLADREVDIPERTKAQPWSDIAGPLAAVTADQPGPERTAVFNTLAVSARANPEIVREAVAAAADYASDDHRFQMVMGALSYAGTPEAQSALLDMYADDGLDALGRESVIDAFTMMTEPATPDALKMLQDAYTGDDPDLRSRAGLALGSAQRNNPGPALRDWIRREWRAADNNVDRQTVLEYVGNSGDPELLPIIDEALRVGDFSIRRLALNSTRFMDAPVVNSYLLEQFQNRELHESLRYEALNALALHNWEERFLPLMEGCVRAERMDAIRMRCARFTLEQLRHEQRMKGLLRAERANSESAAWQEFVDRETTG